MVTKSDTALQKWTLDSWKTKEARQFPNYSNQKELESVLRTLNAFPPFMFAGEDRNLEERLADAAMGNAFSLQCGDCTERFKEFNANNIRNMFRSLLQMGVVLMFGGQMPVIKVGRMASQSAKPRSEPLEEKNAVKLPSYKGDNINTDAFDEKSRTLNPQRLIRAYYQSAITLNLLRAFRHWRVYGHAKSHCWRERERRSGVVPAQCTTRKEVEMERDINTVSLPDTLVTSLSQSVDSVQSYHCSAMSSSAYATWVSSSLLTTPITLW